MRQGAKGRAEDEAPGEMWSSTGRACELGNGWGVLGSQRRALLLMEDDARGGERRRGLGQITELSSEFSVFPVHTCVLTSFTKQYLDYSMPLFLEEHRF